MGEFGTIKAKITWIDFNENSSSILLSLLQKEIEQSTLFMCMYGWIAAFLHFYRRGTAVILAAYSV